MITEKAFTAQITWYIVHLSLAAYFCELILVHLGLTIHNITATDELV